MISTYSLPHNIFTNGTAIPIDYFPNLFNTQAFNLKKGLTYNFTEQYI